MIVYILDTGVVLRTIFPPDYFDNKEMATTTQRRMQQQVLPQWVLNQASLIVPNFVVAETLKFLAHFFLFDDQKSFDARKKDYESAKNIFIDWVRYKTDFDPGKKDKEVNKFFNYELNRHHILNLDKIFECDFTTTPIEKNEDNKPKALSTQDALLIAVGAELRRVFGQNEVYLLTLDSRIEKVCTRHRPNLPRAIFIADYRYKDKEIFPDIRKDGTIIYTLKPAYTPK